MNGPVGKLLNAINLKAKVTLAVVFVVALTVWLVTFLFSQQVRHDLEKVLAAEQSLNVSLLAESIDSRARLRLRAIADMAHEVGVAKPDSPEKLTQFFDREDAFFELFTGGILMYTPDGKLLGKHRNPHNMTAPLLPDIDLVAESAKNQGTLIGRAFKSIDGEYLLPVATPVFYGSSQPTAVFVGLALINGDNGFLGQINRTKIGHSGGFMLFDTKNNIFINATDAKRILQPSPPPGANKMHDRYVAGFEGSGIAVSSRGVEELSSGKRIPTTGWLLVAALSTEEAFAPIHTLQNQAYRVAAVVILLASILIWLFVRRELQPVTTAVRLIQRMSNGKHALHHIPNHRKDELGMLFDSFNQLETRIIKTEHELLRERDFSRKVFEQSSDGVFLISIEDLSIRDCNNQILKILGYSREEFLRLTLLDLINAPEQSIRKNIRLVQEHQRYAIGERKYRNRNGGDVDVEVSASVFYMEQKQWMIATIRDIAERKKLEAETRLMAQVFKYSDEGILISDSNNNIVSVNDAFTQITGYEATEVIGKQPRVLSSGRQGADFYRNFWETLMREGHWSGEIYNRRKNGEIYPEWLSASLIRDEDGTVLNHVAIFSDISERKAHEDRIRHLAQHDFLTNLPNRALLLDRLAQAIMAAQRDREMVGILFIDLDHFKEVNDTLGHQIGDILLQQAAIRMTDAVRNSDTVSRQGGDEFVIILREVEHPRAAGQVAAKLLDSLMQPFEIGEHDLRIGASIGISLYPNDGNSAEELLRHADAAMYRAKESGRNNYQFYLPA